MLHSVFRSAVMFSGLPSSWPGGRVVRLLALAGVAGLVACATPQEKAIAAHCEAEGLRVVPQQLQQQQVMRPFLVGERLMGFRNICRTVTRDVREARDPRSTNTADVRVRETICHDEPIVAPIYEQRPVTELVDLNFAARRGFVRACSAEALAKGLFADLK